MSYKRSRHCFVEIPSLWRIFKCIYKSGWVWQGSLASHKIPSHSRTKFDHHGIISLAIPLFNVRVFHPLFEDNSFPYYRNPLANITIFMYFVCVKGKETHFLCFDTCEQRTHTNNMKQCNAVYLPRQTHHRPPIFHWCPSSTRKYVSPFNKKINCFQTKDKFRVADKMFLHCLIWEFRRPGESNEKANEEMKKLWG